MGVKIPLVCEQAIHLEESREVTREGHTNGDTRARGAPCGFAARMRVLSPLKMESLLAGLGPLCALPFDLLFLKTIY